jgi:hypothetical protein
MTDWPLTRVHDAVPFVPTVTFTTATSAVASARSNGVPYLLNLLRHLDPGPIRGLLPAAACLPEQLGRQQQEEDPQRPTSGSASHSPRSRPHTSLSRPPPLTRRPCLRSGLTPWRSQLPSIRLVNAAATLIGGIWGRLVPGLFNAIGRRHTPRHRGNRGCFHAASSAYLSTGRATCV